MAEYETHETKDGTLFLEQPTPMIKPDRYWGLVDYSGDWVKFGFLSQRQKGVGAGAREVLMHPIVHLSISFAREFHHWLGEKIEEAEKNGAAGTGQTKVF